MTHPFKPPITPAEYEVIYETACRQNKELVEIGELCSRAAVPMTCKFHRGVREIRPADRVRIMIHRMSDEREIFKFLGWDRESVKLPTAARRKLTRTRTRKR